MSAILEATGALAFHRGFPFDYQAATAPLDDSLGHIPCEKRQAIWEEQWLAEAEHEMRHRLAISDINAMHRASP